MAQLSNPATTDEAKTTGLLALLDRSWLKWERLLSWVALLIMSGAYFLAIVHRELKAGPGHNAIDRFVVKHLGHDLRSIDPELLDRIHTFWSPLIFAVGMLILLGIAAVTARTRDGEVGLSLAQRLRALAVGAGGVLAFGLAVLHVPSAWVSAALVLGVVAIAFATARGHLNAQTLQAWLPGLVVSGGLVWGALTLLETGYTWHKELSMMLLLWVGFLGASVATYENRNIQVDFVRKNVPKPWLRGYEAFGSFVTALFTIILAALAYDMVLGGIEAEVVLQTIAIPDFFVPLPILLGFFTIALRYLIQSLRLGLGTIPTPGLEQAPDSSRGFLITVGILLSLMALAAVGMGKGAGLIIVVLALLMVGAPLFVVIGALALSCFALWPGVTDFMASFDAFARNFNLMARMRDLADQESLIAIPFFMIAGAIMSRGAIARQLVECARAAFGWLPGGLAVSTVMACMFFAAISGSSPVTVITIGAIMYPALRQAGYSDRFSMGLVTSAGSLGIIIPPSIPMIVYAIFATMNGYQVDIKHLFIAGVGPGIIIAGALGLLCVVRGIRIPREPFSLVRLLRSFRDGFWALFLPGFILIGIYFGIFNAIEASAMAVILALVIELFIHRALKPSDLPVALSDTATLMGSILIIICVALGLSEFLTTREIPDALVRWLASYELTPLGFVLLLNVMLILVGCLMDIISALILFVPLIIPLAVQLGIDPIHLGLIFIVNLEIGYLTPPLGLNLFVASGFFEKPFGMVMKSVLPFIAVLMASLAVITAFPTISVGLPNLMHNSEKGCSTEVDITKGSDWLADPSPSVQAVCKPFYVPFPSGYVLKPSENKDLDTTPTGFVTIRQEADEGSSTTSGLRSITDRSRVSVAESEWDELLDFDTYGVRAVAVKEEGEHVRTVVVLTSFTENCEPAGSAPEEEELLLRIELPARASTEQTFNVTEGEVDVRLVWIDDDGEVARTLTPTSGMVAVFEGEHGEEIAIPDPEDPYATIGLFGAFELQFDGETLNGKFAPTPCEDGEPVFR